MAYGGRKWLVSVLFGWALFGSWPLAVFMTSALVPFGAETGQGLPPAFWTLSLASLCATMVLMAARESRSLRLLCSKRACAIAATLLVLSAVAMLFAGCFPDSSIAYACGAAGALLSGVSSGYLFVAWQRVLTALTWNEIDVLVPLGYGGSLAISFAIAALAAVLGTVLLFLSLIASSFILLGIDEGELAARHDGEGRAEASENARVRIAKRTWICTAIVVTVLWVPIVFVENSVVSDRTLPNPMFPLTVGAGAAVAAAFSYGAYAFARRADMTLVVRITVPLAILSLAALCFLPREWLVLAYVLSFAANTLMHIFLHVASISLAKSGSCSIMRSTAGILMPLYLASLLSTLLNPVLVQAGVLEIGFLSVALLLLAALFALPLSIGYRPLSFSGENVLSNYPTTALKARGGSAADVAAEPAPLQPGLSGRKEIVLDLARQYGLTKREVEVLELFAVGRDSGYIREKLFISRDTVNTHLKHIYSKLGIHSKHELLDLVESYEE